MRVPLEWLREYCSPDLDAAGIEERLTMTGTKVEAIFHHGVRALDRFVVGRVLEASEHPDADRLRVCRVDVGDEVATIVCGAPNVAGGQTVAVARPGAVLPDGNELGVAKLRGVESQGMILAEDELAIGSDHGGILVLDDLVVDAELAPGTPLADVLAGISTEVLELEITPNRPDCLGVYGVARELRAATEAALAPPPWADDPGSAGTVVDAEVRVECPDLCPRFTARVFEDVKLGPSPPWLKARLMAAGQRPINNVVDITNYVMLLTSQPLHAFDLDRVAGGRLVVRRARDGEQVETLDGQTRTLDQEMVVIEDTLGPTSIAGVMGGARSEVADDTTRVLMESASWDGPNIHRTATALGLRSEASARFEKGLPPEQALDAQAVAARLMVEVCGARLLPGTIDVGGPAPAPESILLRERRVAQILGAPVALKRQASILSALEFEVQVVAEGLRVLVPPFRRNDVTREVDLIEEVGRIDGLDKLPATLPKRRDTAGRLPQPLRLRRRALDALVGRGLYESVGWSFIAPATLDRLRLPADDPRRRAARLANPLSEDLALMRPLLLPSLLDAGSYNAARGMAELRLLEFGTVFRDEPRADDPRLPREQRALGVLLSGPLQPSSWRSGDGGPRADFYAAKGLLEALVTALHGERLELVPASEPFLYPGRAAAVALAGAEVGWIGELHPLVARAWDLEDGAAFELDLEALLAALPAEQLFADVISFPPLRLDLAVVLPDDVAAGAVLAAVRAAAGELLDDVHVFDVYSGPQVGQGRRSLALALSFRAHDRTLTDEDVAPLRDRIVAALAGELGGELRV